MRLSLLVVADRRADLADKPVARIDDRQLGLLAAAPARLFQGGGRQAQRRAVEDVAFQRLQRQPARLDGRGRRSALFQEVADLRLDGRWVIHRQRRLREL